MFGIITTRFNSLIIRLREEKLMKPIGIDILPTAQAAEGVDFSRSVVVVIDVLRATSVITYALANGAKALWPVSTTDEAFELRNKLLAQGLSPNTIILGGERNADIISGFDLGNSPQAYTHERVGGRTVVLTTTNGTLALGNAHGARHLLSASLLNAQVVSQRTIQLAQAEELSIVLLCSGNYGQPTLEDSLCAAVMARDIEFMLGADNVCYLSDHAIGTRMMVEAYTPNSVEWFRMARHYNKLISKGYGTDVQVCLLQVNTLSVVPIRCANGYLVADVGMKK